MEHIAIGYGILVTEFLLNQLLLTHNVASDQHEFGMTLRLNFPSTKFFANIVDQFNKPDVRQ
jgi:hypothetical protein